MSNEQINYKVSADGTEATAAGFNKVGDALDRTVRLQQALGQAQSQSGDFARIAAYRQEADALNATGDRTVGMLSKLTEAANENGRAFGASGRTIQEAGTMIGRVFSEVSGMNAYRGVIDTITRSAALFGSTLLSGGAIVGGIGVIGALGALAYAFEKLNPDIDATSKKIFTATNDVQAFSAAVKKYRDEQLQTGTSVHADAQFNSNMSVGNVSSAELAAQQTAERNATRDKYTANIKQVQGSIPSEGFMGMPKEQPEASARIVDLLDQQEKDLKAIDEKYAQLKDVAAAVRANEQDKAELSSQLSTESPLIGKDIKDEKAKPEKNGDYAARWDAAQTMIDKISKMQTADALKQAALQDDYAQDDIKRSLRVEEEKRRDQQETYDLQKSADRETYELQDKQAKRSQEERKKMASDFSALAGIASATTSKLIIAAAEGQKISGKAILASIGEAMIGEGTRALFTGAIQLASLNPLGALTIGLGVAEIAAGVGLAGAGSSGATPPSTTMPSQPSQDQSAPIGNTTANPNAGPTIIYIDMPSVLSPSADDGMRIRQALQDANHVYGPQV